MKNNADTNYLNILKKIKTEGVLKRNRTGTDAVSIAGATFEHNMEEGFPILTTKFVPFKLISSELEFFTKGITDKRWLQDRKNPIWDEWATSLVMSKYDLTNDSLERDMERAHKVYTKEYSDRKPHRKLVNLLDELSESFEQNDGKFSRKKEATPELIQKVRYFAQYVERDLGPVYGWQWRHFGAEYKTHTDDYTNQGVDQLSNLIDKIKVNPNDRRMIVSAWNPKDIHLMALPACHYGFQVTVIDDKVNLAWNQRSVDTPLGLPFNIASYGLLLHLIAKEAGLGEGKLTGFLMDTHYYVNQIDGINEQLKKPHKELPKIVTENFSSIFDWNFEDSKLEGYDLTYKKDRVDFGGVRV